MIPHNPLRTATEGSGTEDTSGASSAALRTQVVAVRATIAQSLESEKFIYERGPEEEHISPQPSTSYYLIR